MRLKSFISTFCFILVLFCFFLTSCSQMRSIAAWSRSNEHFQSLPSDTRVRYEPGAEEFAQKITLLLPEAIHKVEEKQYIPFIDTPRVYICASRESCFKHTGHKAPAIVTNKLFLSPVLVQEGRPLDRYLAHELSHLHLKQRIGRTGLVKLPSWFSEGLAEVVSGGVSTSKVSEKEVFTAIKKGHVFIPDEGRNILVSFLFPRYGSYWNLDNHMYYRQCMLFVSFLRSNNEEEFRNLLISILNGKSFASAWKENYNNNLSFYWDSFLQDIKQ